MNRQIVKLFGFLLVLYALLFGFTSYWSIFDSDSLKANTANRRPLLEEQKITRGNILADDGSVIARSIPQGKGNNKIYVRHYPQGALFGNPIGYSFVTRAGGLRALPQRRAGRQQDRVPLGPRRAPGARPGGGQGAVRARSGGAAGGRRRARRPARLGGRDRPLDGRGQGDGEHPRVRPQPGPEPERLPASQQRVQRPAVQPRDAGRLSARLDDEGRDRHGRARQRRVQPQLGAQRPLPAGDRRRSPLELGRRAVRRHRHDHRPDQLGQHLVGAGRREARQGHDVQVHGPLRLQRQAAARLPRLPARRQRRLRREQAARPAAIRSTSAASRSARSGCASPRCRWPRSPRRSPTRAS